MAIFLFFVEKILAQAHSINDLRLPLICKETCKETRKEDFKHRD